MSYPTPRDVESLGFLTVLARLDGVKRLPVTGVVIVQVVAPPTTVVAVAGVVAVHGVVRVHEGTDPLGTGTELDLGGISVHVQGVASSVGQDDAVVCHVGLLVGVDVGDGDVGVGAEAGHCLVFVLGHKPGQEEPLIPELAPPKCVVAVEFHRGSPVGDHQDRRRPVWVGT